MENLLSTANILRARWKTVTAERAIHATVFVLLMVGLWIISGYASYTIKEIPLMIASIALSWGVILLALYVTFRKLNWRWWD
jgi:hypothetical protein